MRVGTEQPHCTEVLPVDGDRRHDDGARRERLESVLGADGHREPAVEDVAQQGDDDQLLFEDGQDGAHRFHGVERFGQAGRTADEHLVRLHGPLEGVEGFVRRGHELVDGSGSAGRDGPGLGERAPDQVGGEQASGAGERVLGGLALQLERPLLHGAVGEHHHQEGVQRREADELDRPDGGGVVRGTDHDGGVGGQLGEEARGALEHRLHLPVDLLEELRDLLALYGPQDAGPGQVVDEEAIALVGRDAAGAGVGLDEVPLALERHHFRAHRGGGHLHTRRAGHVGGADGLGGPDVLGDHGLQNGRPAGVEGALVVGNVGERGRVSGRSHGVPGTQVYRVPGP